PARLPNRLLQPRDDTGPRPVRQGDHEVAAPLRVPDRRRRLPDRPLDALLLADTRLVSRRDRLQRGLRDPAAADGTVGAQPRLALPQAADARREPDQRLRRGQRRERIPAERADRRPEPPRHRAPDAASDPVAALPAARAVEPVAAQARRADRLLSARGARGAFPLGRLGPGRRRARAARPVPAPVLLAARAAAARPRPDPGRGGGLPP